jgi:hypothetical protein
MMVSGSRLERSRAIDCSGERASEALALYTLDGSMAQRLNENGLSLV